MEELAFALKDQDYVPDMLWKTFNVTPEALKKIQVIESSVYLTRRCNLKCRYCKIVKTELPAEMPTEKWFETFDLLEAIGVRFVNIAGGEPTILKDIGKIIAYLSRHTHLFYSLVSNSMFSQEKLEEMVSSGLKTYVASVDVLSPKDQTLHDLRKSSAGIKMLERLKSLGVPYLCANIVISGANIDGVMDVVSYLSDHGIWVNICPVVWGRGDHWSADEADNGGYRLNGKHAGQLAQITQGLIEMKRAGALILPTESYIQGIPQFGASLSWKCCSEGMSGAPPRLTIDADGALMTCINMRGTVAGKYNIFDLAYEKTLERFMEDWREDAAKCGGCYWSTMVMARERQATLENLKRRLSHGA